jgi:hypothetical protein
VREVSIPRDVDATLARLEPAERAAVDLLSAYSVETTLTDIVRGLGRIGARVDGRQPKGDDVRPLLDMLTKQGLVVSGERYRVPSDVGHAAMRAAAREGTLERLTAIVRSIAPARKAVDKPISTWGAAVRELRLELYAGRWDPARALAQELPRHVFHDVCPSFHGARFAGLPEDLRSHALAGIVETKTTYLEPATEAIAMLEAEPKLTDGEHRILVERLVLSGRLDDAERRLAGSKSIESDVGRAFVCLLRGRPADALKAYHGPLSSAYISFGSYAVAAALATFTSHNIYGLRRQFEEARRFGQYVLGDVIGEGGTGRVCRAHHAFLRRDTAIKLLLPERLSEAAATPVEDPRRPVA